jgi:hypothetical protein
MKDYICKICRVHTEHSRTLLGNGRYKLECSLCGTSSPVFDIDGKVIPGKQLTEEDKNWR